MELLLQDIEKLEYLAEHASSKSKKREYIIILETLLEFLSELENKETTYMPANIESSFIAKTCINYQKQLINEYSKKEYRDFISIICKNINPTIKQFNEELYFNDTISFKTAKELLLDFFSNFDSSLYPLVKEVLSSNHLFIISDPLFDGEGSSVLNPFSNNSYISISIKDQLSLNNISCLAHELGHIISFRKFKNDSHSYIRTISDTFREVPAISIELLFVDFIRKNKINPTIVEKVIKNNFYIFNTYTPYLEVVNKAIDKIDPMKNYELEELREILRSLEIVKDDNFIQSCFMDFTENHIYSMGYLIAYYYLAKYRLDEEKTKHNIMSFIANIGIYDDFDMMNKFGINIEELKRCGYIKEEINRNQKQLRKLLNFE